jgi:photosystem II stability/assembly factor-like uncharacterized protein
MNLSPLYKTFMFVGGGGWATTLDQSKFYNTKNFGEHWLNVTPVGLESLQDAGSIFYAFSNSELGWICQSQIEVPGVLFSTSDAGQTWVSNQLAFPCGQMAFVSAQEGIIVSDLGVGAGSQYVSIQTTSDAGATWVQVFKHDPSSMDDHGLPSSGIKGSLAMLSTEISLIGGSRPMPGSLYLFRTTDGGSSWNELTCEGIPDAENSELDPMDIIRISQSEVIVPVRAYLPSGQMGAHFCVSTDAGETFNYVSTLENIEFVAFGSLSHGLAYGAGKMMQTSDGGLTWQDVTTGLPIGLTPISLSMMNENVGYLTATASPDTLLQNRIFMTANNGVSWQPMPATLVEPSSN